MPRYCAIPECRTKRKVALFSFPKNPEILECWIHNLNRPFWRPHFTSALCANHFREEDFISKSSTSSKKDQILKESAVPTIFPHLPTNYSLISSQDGELKLERAAIREAELEAIKRERDDFIMCFADFKAQLRDKLNREGYHIFETDDKCVFFLIENSLDAECILTLRISVNNSLKIRVLIGDSDDTRYFEQFRIKNKKLIKWSQLNNVLNAYRDGSTKHETENFNCEASLKRALLSLNSVKTKSSNLINPDTLDILINELEYAFKQSKYNSGTMKMAFLIFSHSRTTLDILRQFLHLPTTSTIQKISSNMLISKNFDIPLKKDRDLSDPENYVALIIDELYIDRSIKYSNDKFVGTAKLNPTQDPKTLLLDTKTIITFTIKSLFGNFHELVRMSPAIYPFGDVVHSHSKSALEYVQELGFNVKVLLADTSKNSQRIFQRFNEKNHYFPNPKYPDHQIYFQFDVIQILKDIRNDWRSLITAGQTFIYADIDTFEIRNASYADLVILFESDQLNVIKKAPKLSENVLKPIDNDRNSAYLAGNIFHESTVLALLENDNCDTADFCATIKKWWDIVTTNEPILLKSDERFIYLEKFVVWLETWRNSSGNPGRLKPSTLHSIEITTKTIIELIQFAFSNCQAEFFHLAKLQKDSLENRHKFYESKMNVTELTSNAGVLNNEEMDIQDNLNDQINWESEYLEEEKVEPYKLCVTVNCGQLSDL